MRSDLVVISWWSNCVGLTCLKKLAECTDARTIYVVQVGKQEGQKELFRCTMPRNVQEIMYPDETLAEHWRVLEYLTYKEFQNRDGVWFVDHDFFILEPFEHWMMHMDELYENPRISLCHPIKKNGMSITSPLFWISPKRLPERLCSFAPVPQPLLSNEHAPFLRKVTGELVHPAKDTLLLAQEELHRLHMDGIFSIGFLSTEFMNRLAFPRYDHLGHLSFLTWSAIPEHLREWCKNMVELYSDFYNACPPEWKSIEDPILMNRLAALQQEFKVG